MEDLNRSIILSMLAFVLLVMVVHKPALAADGHDYYGKTNIISPAKLLLDRN